MREQRKRQLMQGITFASLQLSHLKLLHGWLQEPHVMEFWDDGHRNLEDVKSHYFGRSAIEAWISSFDESPFAYIQLCEIDEKDSLNSWMSKQVPTFGLDLFIGEPKKVGKKLGTLMLAAFIEKYIGNYAPCRLIVDPVSNNGRAIQAYKNVGFEHLGFHQNGGKIYEILIRDIGNSTENYYDYAEN